jgi:dephospho-CoA kinase
MIKLGLTGGIGSGKSLVASVFDKLGVPVYHADIQAKKFLSVKDVIVDIIRYFPPEVIGNDGQVNRKKLADIVFNNPSALEYLNRLIHPRVKTDFQQWCVKQNSGWVIQEAAILFESGFHKYMDKTILVTAPVDVCIKRVMERDKVNREQVIARINNQWTLEKKLKQADYIIVNDNNQPVLPQILKLKKLLDNLEL